MHISKLKITFLTITTALLTIGGVITAYADNQTVTVTAEYDNTNYYEVSCPAAIELTSTNSLDYSYNGTIDVTIKSPDPNFHVRVTPNQPLTITGKTSHTTVDFVPSLNPTDFTKTMTGGTTNASGAFVRTADLAIASNRITEPDAYEGTLVLTINGGHEHTPGTPVRENEIAVTCTTNGSYDEVTYCTKCGAETSRTQKTITKLGHNFVNDECTRCSAFNYPASGTKLANMSFKQIQKIAQEGKASTYGIKVGDTINVNSSVKAAVTEIGSDYIEFATTTQVISANATPQKTREYYTWSGNKSTGKPQLYMTDGVNKSPASFYQEVQVGLHKNSTNTEPRSKIIGYYDSDIRTNVNSWFNSQSNTFKSAIKTTSKSYETCLLKFTAEWWNAGQGIYTFTSSSAKTMNENVYIPSKADINKLKNANVYNTAKTWLTNPSISTQQNNLPQTGCGFFAMLYNGKLYDEVQSDNPTGAIAMFRIG